MCVVTETAFSNATTAGVKKSLPHVVFRIPITPPSETCGGYVLVDLLAL
jgi:hypothetical protein